MTGDLQKTLGRQLRRHRLLADASQEQYAERMGFHRTYWGSLERGERNLSLQSLEHLAEILGVLSLELLSEPPVER